VENITDEILMQNVRNGQLEDMALLFDRYHVLLYNFFLKMGLEKEISQDLTQNLFYRMIKYRSSYREGVSFKSWVYQIARNLHNDYRNLQKKTDNMFVRNESLRADVPEFAEAFLEEDYERLDNALLALNENQRELIVLSKYQGLKYEEISAIVDQSVPAIKVSVHRALKQLKGIYFKQA
jgi:RNA polymerase sigma factor (sigma-70 family)